MSLNTPCKQFWKTEPETVDIRVRGLDSFSECSYSWKTKIHPTIPIMQFNCISLVWLFLPLKKCLKKKVQSWLHETHMQKYANQKIKRTDRNQNCKKHSQCGYKALTAHHSPSTLKPSDQRNHSVTILSFSLENDYLDKRCIKITVWLFGCWGRLRIMASISSNFLRVACTSACSSLYSAYWSLNTARYWSRSSSDRIDGYLLQDGGRESHFIVL